MSLFDAMILGVVEGITEFFPISSTGHLILASKLLNIPESELLQTFEIAIQLGAILAIVFLYWRRFLLDRELIKKLFIALLPALGIGFLLYRQIKVLLASSLVVVEALFIGGAVIVLFEWWRQKYAAKRPVKNEISYQTAFLIGLAQMFAVIPGVSRAGATILGGLALGVSRVAIVEFSFLLAAPTMVAATTLDVAKHASAFTKSDVEVLFVGCLVSFVVALGAVRFLLRYVQNNTFIAFGVYRMVLAALFYFLVL